MGEQPALSFAGLLRQLRVDAGLTWPRATTAVATASTGSIVLDRGYTVRVIPRNDLLTSVAQLGVVALA